MVDCGYGGQKEEQEQTDEVGEKHSQKRNAYKEKEEEREKAAGSQSKADLQGVEEAFKESGCENAGRQGNPKENRTRSKEADSKKNSRRAVAISAG